MKKYFEIVLIILLAFVPFSVINSQPVDSIKAQFFIKKLTYLIHSAWMDDNNFILAGSLGDSKEDFGKETVKKIFKILPDGSYSVYAIVKCKWITALCMDNDRKLFACICRDTVHQIIELLQDGKERLLAISPGEITEISPDENGGFIFYSEKMYKLNNKNEITPFLEKGGWPDKDFKNLYCIDKWPPTKLFRYPIIEKKKLGEPALLVESPYVRCPVFGKDGSVYAYGYSNDSDYLFKIDSNGSIKKIKLLFAAEVKNKYKNTAVTKVRIGKNGFGDNYIYFFLDGGIQRVDITSIN